MITSRKLKYLLMIILILWVVYTIHNPDILQPNDIPNNSILSPAYGYVKNVINGSDYTTVIIALNVFDNHIQYVPCDGTIIDIKYIKGTHPWMGEDENAEQQHFLLRTIYGYITIIQRAGYVYRRIHSKVTIGQEVKTNQELGNIDFGSMVVVKIPINLNVTVKIGDRVNGGSTVLAIP